MLRDKVLSIALLGALAGIIAIPIARALAAEAVVVPSPRLKTKIPLVSSNPEDQPNFIKWRTILSATDWKNQDEHAQTSGVMLDGVVQRSFGDSLKFKSEFFAKASSGYSMTRYGEVKPSKGIGIVDGYVQFSPIQQLKFQAGILDQGNVNAPMLLDSDPFPAVSEAIKIGKEYSVEISAEQAIATTSSLDTKATGNEPTPGFFVEKLKLAIEPKNAVVSGNVFGGLWSFQNLPSNMAGDSDILGNTIVKINGKPQYKYQFEGWLAGAEGKIVFSRYVSLDLMGEMTQNTQAPETYKNSQYAGTALTIKLPRDINLSPGGGIFYAESDSGPGYFDTTELGHNNRTGYTGSLGLTFKRQGFKIAANYMDADVINATALQSHQQLLLLSFETLYAFL
jgi:hypothetical protein